MVYHPCGVPQGSLVGVFNDEGPPVPIPNTEVKLISADNTCLETDREDRSMPTQRIRCGESCASASLAQQVEHAAVNRRVVGSNPTGGAKTMPPLFGGGIDPFLMGLELSRSEQPAHNRSVPGSSP